MKLLNTVALGFAVLSTPSYAQITVLNPFASPQGSVTQLVTASTTDTSCTNPASGTSTVSFMNRKFKMANGIPWNGGKSPYAVCLNNSTGYVRFELHDTPYDHGSNDPSQKRRAEIGTSIDYVNGVTYTTEFDITSKVVGLNKALGNTMDQFQDPKGGSPSISHRLVYCTNSASLACLRTTTRYDEDGAGGNTVNRGQVPFSLGVQHHVKVTFQMGLNGSEVTTLDGLVVSQYRGPIGSSVANGYGLRIGTYGAPLNGMAITQEYRNIAFGK